MSKSKFSRNEDIKKFYDNNVNSTIRDYEFHRWFSTGNNYILYKDTYHSLNRFLSKIKFENVLEVGAGSGIWSKSLFLNKGDKVKLHDVDISKEMINLHKKYFPNSKNISYYNDDITTMDIKKFENKMDLFFSIRCIEYIEDFNVLFSNVNKVLKKNGHGIIITKKTPIVRKAKNHTVNNGMDNLKKSIRKNNLKMEKIIPVSYQIPIPHIRNITLLTKINNWLLKQVFKDKITWFNYFFIESYLVKFSKK